MVMNRNEFFQALPIAKLNLKLTSAALEICTDDIEDIHVMASGGQVDMDELRIALAADVLPIEQPVSKLPHKASATATGFKSPSASPAAGRVPLMPAPSPDG